MLGSVREILRSLWSLWSDWDSRRRRGRIIRVISPLIMRLWSLWNVLWRLVVAVVGSWDVHLVEGESKNIYERRIPRETVIVEDSMRGDDELLRCRIPKSPGLGAIRIADKNTLSCVGLQRLAILLAHEYVGQAAKNAEVGDIRFAPISLPGSIGDTTLQRGRRHPISSVDEGRDSVAPKRRRELRLG